MSKARTLADFISDGSEFADGTISVAEVSGAAPLASPTFTGTASGTFSGPLTGNVTGDVTGDLTGDVTGNVTGNLTGNVTGDVAGDIDLSAIAATIADTAVDIFVYDTRKDSDGGAWRKRTQHTSWYNETLNTATRGSRKEFPAVAVIVVDNSDKITIYDGDDPDLPMWMIANTSNQMFFETNPFCVSALNAKIAIGNNPYDLAVVDFLKDESVEYATNRITVWSGGISKRNEPNSSLSQQNIETYGIIDRNVNDVAMTVLPNAPIDAATGLPVPTIAVATDGGVSVIKDDGTVVDITGANSYNKSTSVNFTPDKKLFYSLDYSGNNLPYSRYIRVDSIPSTDFSATSAAGQVGNSLEFYSVNPVEGQLNWLGTDNSNENLLIANNVGTENGLTFLERNQSAPANGMVAYTTSDYNTGYQVGDIKLATLSDTDDTNVTGSELVTNGDMSSSTGWTLSTNYSITGGKLVGSNTQANETAYPTITTVTGKTYVATIEVDSISAGLWRLYHRDGGGTWGDFVDLSVGKNSITFTAISSTTTLRVYSLSNGGSATFDNLTCRLAEEDRSVNGNGLQVFGTVTKSAVATGADLVGYSGFSGTNYLEQPYNSDLDFGTGDFFVTAWVKPDTMTSYNYIFDKSDSDGTNRFAFYVTPSSVAGGAIEFYTPAHPNNYSDPIPTGVWTHVAWARKNNVSYGYINGQLQTQFYSDENLTGDSTAQLYVGVRYTKATSSSLNEGSISLFRISATAPSPEQIKKIYEDEKVLFQENAQATLYGSSDAVTALAYDDSNGILSVGTSAGRSDFQGLRRVNNTTNAVGAAISASNGMIVEE